jgi:hypothetical protein
MMTEVASPTVQRDPGLLARVLGVITSPRETYAAVAAHPRVLGVLLLTVALSAGVQYWFLSSENGRKATVAAIEGQVRTIEWISGNALDDATYEGMLKGADRAPLYGSLSTLVALPVSVLILAAVFLGVFNGILGGTASFKQVCAIVAHSGVTWTLIGIFAAVMGFVTGRAAGTSSLAVFFPMLDKGFLASLFGYLDLLWFWGLFSTATGLAVLYRRATGPIAATMIGIYVMVGIPIAAFRAITGA